jgi:hypothetical protein
MGEACRPVRAEKKRILRTSRTITGELALGVGPATLIILPVLFEGKLKAVIELASMRKLSETHLSFLDQLTDRHRRGAEHHRSQHAHEALLKQSQSLTRELQSQQES